MAISSAVGQNRRARVSGYLLEKGFFSQETGNLEQVIALLGEANTANAVGLTVEKTEIATEQEAGIKYGFGSPIHQQARILLPSQGGGVGGVRVVVFPQLTDGAATATVQTWTATGTATASGVVSILVNGRDNVNFQSYDFSIVTGDTPVQVATKVAAAINGVISAPVIGSVGTNDGETDFTTKWKGVSSAELDVEFVLPENTLGVTFAKTTETAGTGVVDISTALSQFSDDWYTIVTNPYGESKIPELEQFNGTPADTVPTGRYSPLLYLPFASFFGSKLSDRDALIAITDEAARRDQVTHRLCPAPNSKGFSWEAAANMVVLAAVQYQNSPHTDINTQFYPDMPIPRNGDIGSMKDYNNRDILVKSGCSSVTLKNGRYQVQDLITTYHPEGETPLIFSYSRDINIDAQVAYRYRILEDKFVKDKTLIQDDRVVGVKNVIKPKDWKAILFGFFDDLERDALIDSSRFSKDSLKVEISTTNPNRFEASFSYTRTGLHRIGSTTVSVGF